jgi:hypothetical protein
LPTNRRKRSRVASLDHWKLDDLVTGDCYLSAGYVPTNASGGCAHWTPEQWAEVHAAMREDWKLYGAAIMAWWRGETERFSRYAGSHEDQRTRLKEWLARRGQTQPFAHLEFGHD